MIAEDLKAEAKKRIELVSGWYEGHDPSAIIEELATKWVIAQAERDKAIEERKQAYELVTAKMVTAEYRRQLSVIEAERDQWKYVAGLAKNQHEKDETRVKELELQYHDACDDIANTDIDYLKEQVKTLQESNRELEVAIERLTRPVTQMEFSIFTLRNGPNGRDVFDAIIAARAAEIKTGKD